MFILLLSNALLSRWMVQAARMVGVPTVAELLNLFVDKHSMPTVVVGPSHFSVEHTMQGQSPSERSLTNAWGEVVEIMVISPAVDLSHFKPREMEGNVPKSIFCVAYFGRISIEKNPGLFLLTAREVLDNNPFVRFVVIGDGPLRQSMEELAMRLEIKDSVNFVGMLKGESLLGALRSIDVIVNPSLRAWSETFCIANIEAMAVGIPLVTFAVGGIGEYIDAPDNFVEFSEDQDQSRDFRIFENAVIVDVPTPRAVAAAVLTLIDDDGLRDRISSAGRRTVEKYFSIERQVAEYTRLYRRLQRLGDFEFSTPGSDARSGEL